MKTNSAVVEQLSVLLADTYALALKTQNYHWNVTGPEFYSLHKLFEGQYEALHNDVDLLAERIRALDGYAPGSFTEFSQLTNISNAKKGISSKEMLEDLVNSHESLIMQAQKTADTAEEEGDEGTLDIVVGKMEDRQKDVWMLRSSK
jgi:starvation-inducible DNA-binding protein